MNVSVLLKRTHVSMVGASHHVNDHDGTVGIPARMV